MMKFTPIQLILIILGPVFAITWAFWLLSDEIGDLDAYGSVQSITILGTVFGLGYFLVGEIGTMTQNRSYLANPMTDILAFLGAALVYVNGVRLESSINIFVASAIYTIHLLQTIMKNGLEVKGNG